MATLRTAVGFLFVVALGLGTTAQAASFRDFNGYRVHYNAFNSTVIAPQIAQAYGLNRSDYRGILNITVQRKEGQEPYPAVSADVVATGTNLANQLKRIEMRRIEEGDVVYYIGEFPVKNGEVIDFQVEVTPEQANTYNLQFRQSFFTEQDR